MRAPQIHATRAGRQAGCERAASHAAGIRGRRTHVQREAHATRRTRLCADGSDDDARADGDVGRVGHDLQRLARAHVHQQRAQAVLARHVIALQHDTHFVPFVLVVLVVVAAAGAARGRRPRRVAGAARLVGRLVLLRALGALPG
jgi:hypothetical protein